MLRKTSNGQGFRAGVARASMRPQRNAAENVARIKNLITDDYTLQ